MVEPYAAALAARMHTPETFDAIDGAARAMAVARNVDEWVRADLRFHLSVLEAGGNELLVPLGTLIDRTLEAQLQLNARRADGTTRRSPSTWPSATRSACATRTVRAARWPRCSR